MGVLDKEGKKNSMRNVLKFLLALSFGLLLVAAVPITAKANIPKDEYGYGTPAVNPDEGGTWYNGVIKLYDSNHYSIKDIESTWKGNNQAAEADGYECKTLDFSHVRIEFYTDATLELDKDIEIERIRAEKDFSIKAWVPANKPKLKLSQIGMSAGNNLTITDCNIDMSNAGGDGALLGYDYLNAGKVIIKNSTVNIKYNTFYPNYGIRGGYIEISNSDVSVEGPNDIDMASSKTAIYSEGNIVIDNSKIKAIGNFGGIYAANSMTISGKDSVISGKTYNTSFVFGSAISAGNLILKDDLAVNTPSNGKISTISKNGLKDVMVVVGADGMEVKEALIKYKPSAPKTTSIKNGKVVLKKSTFTYNGKALIPVVKTINGLNLKEGTDYTVTIKDSKGKTVSKPKASGKYKLIIKGKGKYSGTLQVQYKIEKASNTLKVATVKKSYDISYTKLKSKKQTLDGSKLYKFTDKKKTKGTINYTLSSVKKGTKKIKTGFSINKKSGQMTIKKGLVKGTYKVTVKVTAGDSNYKEVKKDVTFTIKIK
jgi:hypothetical protein